MQIYYIKCKETESLVNVNIMMVASFFLVWRAGDNDDTNGF